MDRDGLTMLLVGDVYIKRDDPPSVFALAGPLLRSAEFVFGNLETPITDVGTRLPGRTASNSFRSPPDSVTGLTAGNFHAVGLANNHSMDMGPDGMMRTIELLDEAGIGHCGAGRNIVEAHRPAVVNQAGCKVAFLSYSSVFLPGLFPAGEDNVGIATVKVNTAYAPPRRVFEQPGSPATTITTADPQEARVLIDDVRRAKQVADIVVVSWHWGVSQSYRTIVNYQTDLGRAVIDAGADVVLGHHPHCLEAIEVYGSGLICYSAGNFAFDHYSEHCDARSMIVKCQIVDGRIVRWSFLPVLINADGQPEILDPVRGAEIVTLVREASREFSTDFEIADDEVVIRGA